MKARTKRRLTDRRRATVPHLPPQNGDAVRHLASPTAVAAEALRTGVMPRGQGRRRVAIPREDSIQVGDPDDRVLDNEYGGEETPGASAPTPDQNGVDEIGRAYGLQEEDTGALRSSGEVLARRDRHRVELQPPTRPRR